MSTSFPSKKAIKTAPKGYTLHEPRSGSVPKEVLDQRLEKLGKLMAKARKTQDKSSK
jgi:hypothetical protein